MDCIDVFKLDGHNVIYDIILILFVYCLHLYLVLTLTALIMLIITELEINTTLSIGNNVVIDSIILFMFKYFIWLNFSCLIIYCIMYGLF